MVKDLTHIEKLMAQLQQATTPDEKRRLRKKLRKAGHEGGLRNTSDKPTPEAKPGVKPKTTLSPARVEEIRLHNTYVTRKISCNSRNCDFAVVYKHDNMSSNPIINASGKSFHHIADTCFNGERVLVFTKHQAEYIRRKGGVPVYENA